MVWYVVSSFFIEGGSTFPFKNLYISLYSSNIYIQIILKRKSWNVSRYCGDMHSAHKIDSDHLLKHIMVVGYHLPWWFCHE